MSRKFTDIKWRPKDKRGCETKHMATICHMKKSNEVLQISHVECTPILKEPKLYIAKSRNLQNMRGSNCWYMLFGFVLRNHASLQDTISYQPKHSSFFKQSQIIGLCQISPMLLSKYKPRCEDILKKTWCCPVEILADKAVASNWMCMPNLLSSSSAATSFISRNTTGFWGSRADCIQGEHGLPWAAHVLSVGKMGSKGIRRLATWMFIKGGLWAKNHTPNDRGNYPVFR